MGLPEHLSALLYPRAYPHPVQAVELVETHISWILLTGEFAYKLKRPVCYPFIDLTSAERRAFFCREELRLDRRFAPQLYLEVCAITARAGEARIGGTGEVIEEAVKMRQFRREDELDRLLEAGRIEPLELETFGHDLAVIHGGLPVAATTGQWGSPQAVQTLILENLEECAREARVFGNGAGVHALRESVETRLKGVAPCMSDRLAGGRVRECHGDLHTRNVVRLQSRLVAFDCIEFEPAFRWIDVAEEIAFLLADLHSRQRPLHAHAFLSGYLAESGDYQACRVLDLYKAHRALVRAKISSLSAAAAAEPQIVERKRDEYNAYLECARQALSVRRPMLVLMCGFSGSGKTWLARRIAPSLDAVHLRSDVERKRSAGRREQEHSASGIEQGLYSPETTADLYEHLARCTGNVLAGGYTAIVDASFRQRADRARFRELAGQLGVAIYVVYCSAPPETLRARVVERAERGDDASEADLSVLRWQEKHFESIRDDERLAVIGVTTTDADAVSQVTHRLRALTSARRS